MKKSLLVLLVALTATIVSAQKGNENNNDSDENTESFNRKGRVLIETGYNLIGGLPIGGGTGVTSISDEDDNSFSGIGFNGGYFVSQNFALKLSISNLDYSNFNVSSFGVGAKYYIAGKVPIDLIFGNISSEGSNEGRKYTTLSVGYGIRLADNINLEPAIGIFGQSNETIDDAFGVFSLNFSMFL